MQTIWLLKFVLKMLNSVIDSALLLKLYVKWGEVLQCMFIRVTGLENCLQWNHLMTIQHPFFQSKIECFVENFLILQTS